MVTELSLAQIADYLTQRFVVSVWLPLFTFVVAIGSVAVVEVGIGNVVEKWSVLPLATQVWFALGAFLLITFWAYICDALLDTMVRFYEGYWPSVLSPLTRVAMREQKRHWQHLMDRSTLALTRQKNIQLAKDAIAQDVSPTPSQKTRFNFEGWIGKFEQPIDGMIKDTANWPALLSDIQKLRSELKGSTGSTMSWAREQEERVKEGFLRRCEEDLERVTGEYERLYEALYFNFPQESVRILPTRLGNILRAAEEYGESAYNLDAPTVWPRLVPHLPKEFQARLQQSTTPLTTMLFSSMLSFLFAVLSGSWIALTSQNWLLLAGVVISGVLLSIWFYESTLQRATEYGLLIRTAFDLYRHELLKAIDVPLPPSPREERTLWDQLTAWWYLGEPPIDENGNALWRYESQKSTTDD